MVVYRFAVLTQTRGSIHNYVKSLAHPNTTTVRIGDTEVFGSETGSEPEDICGGVVSLPASTVGCESTKDLST